MYVGNALQTAIYTALNGTITGEVTDSEDGASYPYTVIGDDTDVPDDLRDGQGTEVTCTLHIWSAEDGAEQVKAIIAEIDAVLHRQTLAVAGATCWFARREFTDLLRDEDPDTGGQLRHGIARYRFRLEA